MKQRLEQGIRIAISVVSGAAAFGADPMLTGLALAGLNAALALCTLLQQGDPGIDGRH